MNETSNKSIEVRFERKIHASPDEVFDAWLSAEVPGTVWHAADKMILDRKQDGLFFWRMRTSGTPHYGRFTEFLPGKGMTYTWVSAHTLGKESIVTVSFSECDEGTKMSLVHSHLPDTEQGRRHEQGWNYFLDRFYGSATAS